MTESPKLERVPTVEKLVVFLDLNVIALALKNPELDSRLKLAVSTKRYEIPFTHVHIGEVNRIYGEDRDEYVQKHLAKIEELSSSRYLDFRADIGSFTIRDEDPFKIFDNINEVPVGFIDSISKMAAEDFLVGKIPGLPKDCFRMADLYEYFGRSFRQQFPGLGQKLNQRSKQEAIGFLEKVVFQGMSFDQLYELATRTQKEAGLSATLPPLDEFVESTLYMAGFNTPSADLRKPHGLLSDHQYLRFTNICDIVISNDANFRKKVLANAGGQKLVLDPEVGVLFLLAFSGSVNLVDEKTGDSLNKRLIEAVLPNSVQAGELRK